MTVRMDLRVASADWQAIEDLERVCQHALEAAADICGSGDVSVDVLLAGDDMLAELNETWRGKPGPTDVLSFPSSVASGDFAGDIAIAFGTASRDAAAAGVAIGAHLSHLLVHGVLHLFGHDHVDEGDAVIMEALETRALARLGHADPYSRIAET